MYDLYADAVIVEEGRIDMHPDDVIKDYDYYQIDAFADDNFTIEVISKLGPGDPFDTAVALLDPAAGYAPVPWWPNAMNDNERESTDSLILDVTIPADGTYVVEVYTPFESEDTTGDYEMLIYRIGAMPSYHMADFNQDGRVDPSDFSILAGNWLMGGEPSDGDANGDGFVDPSDFAILAGNWLLGVGGISSTSVSVPEPSTTIMALVATAGFFGYRRRRRGHLSYITS